MKKLALASLAGIIALSMAACSKAPEEPAETTTQAVKETESKDNAAASTGVTIEFVYNL